MKGNKSNIYLIIIMFLLFSVSIGYALIQSNLEMGTKILIKGYENKVLYDVVALNAVADNVASEFVSNASGIQFNAVGSDTNGKGVYTKAGTENDTYPVYYYRGEVTNNYVKFAGYCWKMVRTTSTGGVKLIYNGSPLSDGSCGNTGSATFYSSGAFNSANADAVSMAYVGYMYGDTYEFSSPSMSGTKYLYANDITYSNGSYTLSGETYNMTSSWAFTYNNIKRGHKYTCLSKETTCTEAYYVYDVATAKAHMVKLTGGKLLTHLFQDTLTVSSNTTSSTVKGVLDSFYSTKIYPSYHSYIEDTDFCTDRTIYEYNAWDKDLEVSTDMRFNGYDRDFVSYTPIVTCPNANDKFTVSTSKGNGKLTYPVGLLTADEGILAGGGTNSFLNETSDYWLLTPSYYSSDGAHVFYYSSAILASLSTTDASKGIRPVISLKYGTEYSQGDGTATNPYIIK